MHPTPAQHGKSTTVQGSENHILLLCPAFLRVGWLSLSLPGRSSVCAGVVLETPAHTCLEVEAGSQPGPQRGSQPKQLEALMWPGFLRAWRLGSRGEHPSRNGQSLPPVVTQPEITQLPAHLVTGLPDFKGAEHRPRCSETNDAELTPSLFLGVSGYLCLEGKYTACDSTPQGALVVKNPPDRCR